MIRNHPICLRCFRFYSRQKHTLYNGKLGSTFTISAHECSNSLHSSLCALFSASTSSNSCSFFQTNRKCSNAIDVYGPAFAESISEGDIRWLKEKGDFVNEDDIVAEIETDKTTVEVPATVKGTIEELLILDGGKVAAKQKLFKLKLGNEASVKEVEEKTTIIPEKKTEEIAPVEKAAISAVVIDVYGPAFAESISEGDIRWLKVKGDFVNEDDIVAEIETDKTTVEVPATVKGTIEELLILDGGKVAAKQKLFKLKLGNEASVKEVEEKTTIIPEKKTEEIAPVEKAAISAPSATPPIPTTIPKMPTSPLSSTPVSQIKPGVSRPVPVEQAITGSREETRVKMNRMRLRIAERLKDAQNTYAMLTTFNEIDMSNVIEMRQTYQNDFIKKHNIKLGFMSPFIRAAVHALQDQPIVNAVIDEDQIVYRSFVDISVAVATAKGLVVPVLRNAEAMNDYAQIEMALSQIGEKARHNKLAIEDMEGGTFTISNGGVFGSLYGTPIINPPQSAILGMHSIVDKPVARCGKVEIRPIMVVALTYDHRLVDGREAVTFLKKIKSAVEDPRSMLLAL